MNLQTKKTIVLFSSLLFIASVQSTAFAAKKAAKASPCKDVGAIDLNAYCQKKMGGKAELKDKTIKGWRCMAAKDAKGAATASGGATNAVNTKYNTSISMDDACKMQYGENAKAEASNPKDPYSWRCVQCTK